MQPDDATLRRLYEAERLSLADIGRVYGVHKNQVRRWLVRAEVPTRDVSAGTKLAWKGQTEKQRAATARNAAVARSFLTEESRQKQAAKMKGRQPYNAGGRWTPEEREKHRAYRATPEYRAKLAASQTGEKNANWKGGVKSELDRLLDRSAWRQRRREVYERDNWTCQDCGCKCLNSRDARLHPKRKIQAHHRVARRVGGTDELENLVTLCMSCHHKREHRGE